MRTSRRLRALRIPTALLAGICILVAAPPGASAREKDENLWVRWWEGVTIREDKLEIPFIVLASIPAMLLITPIWLVQLGLEGLSSEDGGDSQ
jgi:hypothetical protein